MIYETFKKEFLAVSSLSMLAGCGPGSPDLRGRLPGRARMHAGARARGQGADRAEGPGSARLRLRQFSGCWVLGSCGDLRLLLDDNYSRTITNITAEAQSTRRTNEWRRLLLRSSGFLKCGCCRRSGLGCARGHSMCAGPSGLRRCCQAVWLAWQSLRASVHPHAKSCHRGCATDHCWLWIGVSRSVRRILKK
jgi:hypothetical protein